MIRNQDDPFVTEPILAIAERIARQAHATQVEESTGESYANHLERVAGFVFTDAAKIVAWLHDILEDTPVIASDLRHAGIPNALVETVVVLTHRHNETYMQYIDRVLASGDALAIEVKRADLCDHLRPNCPARLRPRYVAAMGKFDTGWTDADLRAEMSD